MAVFNRRPVLMLASSRDFRLTPLASIRTCRVSRFALHASRLTLFGVLTLLIQGCGLLIDAVTSVYPQTANDLDRICRRQQVQVGMAVEPFRPFVFPAVWTDEGARVTGLDTELVKTVSDALTIHCGTSVAPVLHLVRFRDLFLLLNEGRLDFFVSAVATGVPSPTRAGIAYSSPYFFHGGVGAIAKRPEVLDRLQARLQTDGTVMARQRLLDGMAVAVQENTAAHLYVEANVRSVKIILCDSLPAAFEHADAGSKPLIDVILGAEPVLEFMVKTTRRDWRLLTREGDKPLRFTQADYAVVLAEESYNLRWFINQVIFQLAESGRLQAMRKRWIEDSYAYPRRASTEGLPFDVPKMVAHYDQGTCREGAPR